MARTSESGELAQLQSRIVQAEKLASIGQVAANVVHELNNPLTAITTYADYLLTRLPALGAPSSDMMRVERIREAALRISAFTRDLAGYARPEREGVASLSARELVERAASFCEHLTAESKIPLEIAVDPDLSLVGRRGPLTQVFVNLITNATHAVVDAGLSPEEAQIRVSACRDPNSGKLVITVEDNGPGISQEHIVRIFDPFFTTKSEGTARDSALNRSNHRGRTWWPGLGAQRAGDKLCARQAAVWPSASAG